MSNVTYTIDSETGALIKVNNATFVSQDPTYYNTYIATSNPANWVNVTLNISSNTAVTNEQVANTTTSSDPIVLNSKNVGFFGSMKDTNADNITSGNMTKLIDGGGGNDTIMGNNNSQYLFGGLGDDTITGSNVGGNILYGGAGNDVLKAGKGNATTHIGDTLYGGSGNDTLYGGEHGSSVLVFDKLYAGTGDDIVYITNGGYAEGGTGTDTLVISLTAKQAGDAQVRTALTAYKNFLASNPAPGTIFDFYAYGSSAPSGTPSNDYQNSMNLKVMDFEILKIYVNGSTLMANPDVNSVTEGQTITGSVATNDFDPMPSPVLTYTLNAPVAGLTLNSNGSYSFNAADPAYTYLAQGQVLQVVANYMVKDQFGASANSTLTITVTGVSANQPPVAVADTNSGNEDTTITGSVATNDSDPDPGTVLTYSLNSPVPGLTLNPNGSYSFDAGNAAYQHLAQGGATQNVVANYTVSDGQGGAAQSTLTITLTGTNDGPIAVADTASAGENEIKLINVLANDTDVDDGHVFTLTAVSAPAGKGSVSIVGNQLQFNPGTNFDHLALGAQETIVLNYTMRDEFGASSSSTVNLTITGTNDGPVAVVDTASAGENEIKLINVLANDTDVDDGHVFTLTAVSAPAGKGSVSIGGNQLQFNPGTDFDHLALGAQETIVLNYTMQDEHGASSSSTVNLTITGTNDGPVAVADTASTGENEIKLIDVLANDTDVDDGHIFTLTAVSGPANKGSVSIVGNQLQFNPGTDFDHLALGAQETIVLNYTMRDEHGASSSSTVNLTITGTNDGPVAVADTASAGENETKLIDVLANDTDVDDGHAFTLTAVSAPLGKGSVSIVGNQLQFNPGTDFDHLALGAQETIVLNYTMRDEHGASSSSTVNLTITGTNDGPVAVADTASAGENETKLIDVLANDTDVDDGHAFTLTAVSAPLGKGSVSIVGNQLQFNPGADFDHLAQGEQEIIVLNYTMQDEFGASSSSTVSLTIIGAAEDNTPAVITGTADGSVTEDSIFSTGGQLTITDPDAGEDRFQIPASLAGAYGNFSFDEETGVWGYTLNNALAAVDALNIGSTLTDTLVVQSYDGTASQLISVTIHGANDAPVAVVDTASAGENETKLIDVLANDTDVDDGHAFTLTAVSAPLGKGSVSIVGNQLQFNPGTDFDHLAFGVQETIVLNYTMQDEFGASSSSTVNLTITGTNDGPVAVADTASAGENETKLIDVLANDTDVDDGHAFTLTAVNAPLGKGSVSIVGNQLQFNPGTDFDHLALGAQETIVLNYTMQDEFGASSSSTVNLTITGTNDAATITGEVTGSISEIVTHADGSSSGGGGTSEGGGDSGNPETVIGTLTASDVDNAPNTFMIVSNGATTNGYGTYAMTADGLWTYTLDNSNATVNGLNNGQTLTDSFTVYSVDNTPQVINITINGANDEAIITGDVEGSVTEDGVIPGVPTVTGVLTDTDVDNPENSFMVATAGTASINGYGTYEMTADGTWTYTLNDANSAVQALNNGDILLDLFKVKSIDGTQQTINIVIHGTNDAAVLSADVRDLTETNDAADISASGTLTITDVDNPASFVEQTDTDGSYGTFTIAANGAWTYTADSAHNEFVEGVIYNEHFVVMSVDGTQTAVDIHIAGTNDGPVAVADEASAAENETKLIDVLGNDTDLDDGHILTLTAVSAPPGKGTVSIVGNMLQFNPGTDFDHLAQGQQEVVILSYTMQDEYGAASSADVALTITGINDGPVAVADTASAGENETKLIDVLANDTDVDDGHAFTLTAVSAPLGKGTASIVGNMLQFNPGTDFDHLAQGQQEIVTLHYTMEDEYGAASSADVALTITGTNDGPVAMSDSAFAGENETKLIDVLANDTDKDDGHVFTLFSVSAPVNKGTASIVGNQLQFNPGTDFDHLAQGATEIVNLNYTMQDEFGVQSSSTVTLTVNGANDAPIADADTNSGNEDSIITGFVANNDSDVDDSVLTYSLDAPVAGLTINSDGSYSFDAGNAAYQHIAQGAFLDVVANYTVTDMHGASDSSTLTITVAGFNDAPIAVDDVNSVNEDGAIPVSFVSDNDTDVDDDGANRGYILDNPIAGLDFSQNGEYVFNANQPEYQHLAQGATQDVVVNYTVIDSHGASDNGTLTITITGINDAPIADAYTNSGNEDSIITGSVANDSDPDDGASLSYSLNAPVAGLTLNSNGSYSFNAGDAAYQALAQGEITDVVISYRVTDEFNAFANGTLTITLTGTNDDPVISGVIHGDVKEDVILSTSGQLTASDDNNSTQTWSIVNSMGFYGTMSVSNTGLWTYTLGGGQFDVNVFDEGLQFDETFTARVTDQYGTTDDQIITVTVTGTNDTPTFAFAPTASIQEDTAFVDRTFIVFDPDSSSTKTYSLSLPNGSNPGSSVVGTYGTLSILSSSPGPGDGSGTLRYSLNNASPLVQALAAGEQQTDVFTIKVQDEFGAMSTQTVTITVTGTNDAPVISGVIHGDVIEDVILSSSGQLTASDDHSSVQTWSVVNSMGFYGTMSISNTGLWTYTLGGGQFNVNVLDQGLQFDETFTARVTDQYGAIDDQIVTVTVTGTNDTPTFAFALNASIQEDTAFVNRSFIVFDPDSSSTKTYTLSLPNGSNPGSSVVGTYGTLNILSSSPGPGDGSGTLRYTLNNASPVVQALAAGEQRTDVFTMTVQDEFGATTSQPVTITITGTDDPGTITGTSTGSVIEAAAGPGTPTATGTLVVTDIDSASPSFTAFSNASTTYGTASLSAAGVWTYNLNNFNSTVDALNTGNTLIDTFVAQTNVGVSQVVTITINGADDPTIFTLSTPVPPVIEAGGINNNTLNTPLTSGFMLASDVDNAPPNFSSTLLVNPLYGSVSMFPTAGGNPTRADWEYTLNNSNPTVQALNVGDTLTDTFVTQTVGGGYTQTIVVTIQGRDDIAVISGTSSGTVTEAGAGPGTPTSTGTLTVTDPDSAGGSPSFIAFSNVATPHGTASLTAGGAWSFTLNNSHAAVDALNVGNTLIDTFVAQTNVGASQIVTITINGADDPPTFIQYTDTPIIEAGGVNNNILNQPTTYGFVSISDPDNPPPNLSGTLLVNPLYGSVVLTLSNGGNPSGGQWDYTVNNSDAKVQALNVGDILTDTFVTQTVGGANTQTFVVTIQGRDDKSVITGTSSGSVTEKSGLNNTTPGTDTASATLTVTDVDSPAAFLSTLASGPSSTYGSTASINTLTGVWTYIINDTNPNVEGLRLGDSVLDSFVVQTIDGIQKTINVSIVGRNDAPIAANLTFTFDDHIQFTAMDVDNFSSVALTGNGASAFGSPIITEGVPVDLDVNAFVGNGVTGTLSITDNSGLETVFMVYVTGTNFVNTITGQSDTLNFSTATLPYALYGRAGIDFLTTGSGNDFIDGGTGNDFMTGGLGNDVYVIDAAGDGVSEGLNAGTDLVYSFVSDTLDANVENLTLVGTAVSGTGNALVNTIIGNSQNNTLSGLGGNDYLDGGTGADTMIGGTENDTYIVENVGDVVTESLNEGTDIVFSSRDYGLTPNVENLILTGTALQGIGNNLVNTITGNSIGNFISGGVVNTSGLGDTFIGGLGDDQYTVFNTLDVIVENAGEGNDRVLLQDSFGNSTYTLSANLEHLTISGSLIGTFTGNASNNSFVSGTGINTFIGAGGVDSYFINNSNDVVIDNGSGFIQSTVSYDMGLRATQVPNLTLSGTAITGTGNALNNTIIGNSQDNTLNGGGGNDYIDGGIGNDRMSGGTGNDTFIVNSSSDLVIENLGEGAADTVLSSVTYTLAANMEVESLILTGIANLNGTGNNLTNTITGNSGNNTLDGGLNSNPSLGDLLIGVGGTDTYLVKNLNDVVTDNGNGTVIASISGYDLSTHGTNVKNLMLTLSATAGTGNALNNIITSNPDNSVNTLTGGGGVDTYLVYNSATQIFDNGFGTVISNVSFNLPADVNNLILNGNSLTGRGNLDDNVITSNGINNTLIGGGGTDTYIINGNPNITDNTVINDIGGVNGVLMTNITYNLSQGGFNNVGIDILTLTGTGNIDGIGNFNDNIITGNSGNNTLVGMGGHDTYYVQNASDVVIDSGSYQGSNFFSGDNSVVYSTVSFSLAGSALSSVRELILTGTNLTGQGNSNDNIITSNNAGAGVNTLYGGGGSDTYIINSDLNEIQDNTIPGPIAVSSGPNSAIYSSVSFSLSSTLPNQSLQDIAGTSTIEQLILTGTNAINATGNSLSNIIIGNSAANTLHGVSNGSTIAADTLTGGGGADAFKFDLVPINTTTTITDFVSGTDYFLFKSSAFGSPSQVGNSLNPSEFVVGFANQVDQRFVYVSVADGFGHTANTLYFDFDANGPGAADPIATLTGVSIITAADIHLY